MRNGVSHEKHRTVCVFRGYRCNVVSNWRTKCVSCALPPAYVRRWRTWRQSYNKQRPELSGLRFLGGEDSHFRKRRSHSAPCKTAAGRHPQMPPWICPKAYGAIKGSLPTRLCLDPRCRRRRKASRMPPRFLFPTVGILLHDFPHFAVRPFLTVPEVAEMDRGRVCLPSPVHYIVFRGQFPRIRRRSLPPF